MAFNSKPCQQCRNYDVIRQGSKGIATRGWCTIRSVYPAVESPGQNFPDGVKRAASGTRATPFIVLGSEVRSGCSNFTQK
jgi:hypothetical protein